MHRTIGTYMPGELRSDGNLEPTTASWPADHAPSAESGSPTGLPLQPHALEASLTRLIGALAEQTEAINRLAGSNEALVQAMAQSEGMGDDEGQPGAYLNGSPVR